MDAANFLPVPGHNDDLSQPGKAGQDSPQNTIKATTKDQRVGHGAVVPHIPRQSNNVPHELEDFDIPWCDLIIKERIGAGIFPSSFICMKTM